MEAERVSNVMRLSGDTTLAQPDTADGAPVGLDVKEQVDPSPCKSRALS